MSRLKHIVLAFQYVETKLLWWTFLFALLSATIAVWLTQEPYWISVVFLAPGCLVLAKIFLEMELPELGCYREEVDKKAWAQAAFYLILAQNKVKARPWLQRLNLLRPRVAHKVLSKHLESELAAVRLLGGEQDEAERMLRRLTEQGDAEGWVHHNLAVCLFSGPDWKEARPHILLARALGVAPPHGKVRLRSYLNRRWGWSPHPSLEWVIEVGTLYQALGFHELALPCLSLSIGPERCFQCVNSLLALQRSTEAENLAREATHHDPGNAMNWLALGLVEFQKGEQAEAILHLGKARSVAPENKMVTTVYYEMKIWNSGPEQLRNLLALVEEYEEDSTVNSITEASILGELGEWEQSLKILEKVMDGFTLEQASPDVSIQVIRCLECVGYALIHVGVPYIGVSYLSVFCDISERANVVLIRKQERRDKAMELVEQFVASPF